MNISTQRRILTARFCFACLIVTATSIWQTAFADEDPPRISVSGSAEILVTPDEAVFSFSIESREDGLEAAVKDNDERIKAVTAFLKESKVEDKHIRTEVITIRPIFEQRPNGWKGQMIQAPAYNNAPLPSPGLQPARSAPLAKDVKKKIQPIGYTARRSLLITIKDLAAFETIYRGLIAKGVNDVSGIEFRTTELRKHRDEARLKAVTAAREKAEAMAAQLGASLASVQQITEGSSPMRPTLFQNSSSVRPASNGTNSSVAAGMIEITASVHVVFLLGDTELIKK